MKRTAIIAAILIASALAAGAQDQPLFPVLMDGNNVIIKPNPQVFATANKIVMTTDALYSFITNSTLVSAATGTVADVAALNATITNIPAASVTSGNIAVARITNAAATVGASIGGNIPAAAMTNGMATTIGLAASAIKPNAVAVTNVIVSGDAKTNTIVVIGGQITSWTVTE